MKMLVLCLFVGLASADIGLVQRGYEYKVPHTTYGVPSHNIQTGSASLGSNNAQATQTGQEFAFASQGSNAVNGGQASYTSQAHQSGYQKPAYPQPSSSGINYEQQNQGAIFAQQSQGSSFGQQAQAGYQQTGYQTSGTPYVQSFHQEHSYQHNYVQQPPQIFRHVYVHAAPEDHEEKVYRQAYVPPPPQKHYKIIFIKAPTQSAQPVQVIPPHPQTEEKTIVYVLVKKQDGQSEIVVPKAQPHKPTKPEVYFIKYDAKKAGVNEQGVINNIVSNLGQAGAGQLSGVTVTDASGSVLSNEQTSGIISGISSGVASASSIATGHNTGYTQVSDRPYATGTSSSQSSYDQGEQHTYTQGAQSGQSSFGIVASDTASHELQSNHIQSSIGLPHETYGPPKFRV